jgi:Bacterial alpha-L-rhamnosidase.
VGDITNASTTFESPNGTIRTDWKKDEKQFELSVEIPVNSTATVYLPCSDISEVTETENGKPMNRIKEIQFLGKERNKLALKIGSGTYNFKITNYSINQKRYW